MAGLFWIYSHNFTHTGAPLVMAAIAKELAANGWRRRLRLLSWGGHHDRVHTQLRRELQKSGLHCQVLEANQIPPTPNRDDRVLLNSVVLPQTVLEQSFSWLEQGKIQRLDWYAHEASPDQLLRGNQWPKRLQPLLNAAVLQMRVPSQHCLATYQQWLEYNGNSLAIQHPQLELIGPDGALMEQPLPSFQQLKLQLTGMAGDGNKGHCWLLRLIQQSVCQQAPGLRPLTLQFIGLESDSHALLDRELRFWGQALLGENFSWTPHGNRNQALAAMGQANLAVICSRQETFSMVAVEAMALGQPLLRNRSGGWHEQLIEGVTGFDLGETGPDPHPDQLQLLQRLRNPAVTSEAQLQTMAQAARAKAATFAGSHYASWLIEK
jgi:hypothetical protein